MSGVAGGAFFFSFPLSPLTPRTFEKSAEACDIILQFLGNAVFIDEPAACITLKKVVAECKAVKADCERKRKAVTDQAVETTKKKRKRAARCEIMPCDPEECGCNRCIL